MSPDPRPSSPQERWSRLSDLFAAALELPGPDRRPYLLHATPNDPELLRELLAMLAAHEDGTPLLFEEERRLRPSDPLLRAHDLPAGSRVGPWRVEALVGQGGMGEVYRAERVDGAYRQVVALKVLRPGYRTAETVRRFRVERQALARLVHPGIAAIVDGGSLADGRPYLVLQYVDGSPITRFVRDRGLDLEARLRLFVRVARVVEFAHAQLVIHRDLKPSNILVEADGTPRLLDFGIARLLDPDADASLVHPTRPESRLLTPEHAAPEQLRGEPCDTRTDVYGLGVLLFQLLTERTPFPAAHRTLLELERAILEAPAPLASASVTDRALARRLRGDLDVIVQAALRKEPDRRYGSATALADDVERYLAGLPVRAQPDRFGYRAEKFLARNRALVVAGVVTGALLVGTAVTATLQARRAARERDRAEQERAVATDMVQILTGLFDRANPRKVAGGDTVRVVALLDEAEQRIAQLAEDSARQAALLKTVGEMRGARGEYARAESLLRRAVDLRVALAGADDEQAAIMYHELAVAVLSYRGAEAARPMFDSSLATLRRIEPPGAPDLRVAINDLAAVTPDRRRRQALFAELVALESADSGLDTLSIANRMHTQAIELLGQGRSLEAAALFEQTLTMLGEQLPPDNPVLQTITNNLSVALGQSGQLAAAESLQRATLAAVTGKPVGAADRAGVYERLALTIAALGKLAEADSLEALAVSYYAEGLAPNHGLVASAVRNLALLRAARGRTDEGLALLDSAMRMVRRATPVSPPYLAYLGGQRIPLLLRQGRLPEAVTSLAFADSVLPTVHPPGSPKHNDLDRWGAMVAIAQRRFDAAVIRASAAYEGTRQPGAPIRFASAQLECLLGVALAGAGRTAEARLQLDEGCNGMEAWGLADPLILKWGREARQRLAHP